jgi:hypothetical protein
MKKKVYLATILTGIAIIGAGALFATKPVAAQTQHSAAVFTADGKLTLRPDIAAGFSSALH